MRADASGMGIPASINAVIFVETAEITENASWTVRESRKNSASKAR